MLYLSKEYEYIFFEELLSDHFYFGIGSSLNNDHCGVAHGAGRRTFTCYYGTD